MANAGLDHDPDDDLDEADELDEWDVFDPDDELDDRDVDDEMDDEMDDDHFDSLDDLEQEVFFRCPWCAETVSALVELSDAAQSYVEDCEVCCRPMTLHIWRSGRRMRVEARAGG